MYSVKERQKREENHTFSSIFKVSTFSFPVLYLIIRNPLKWPTLQRWFCNYEENHRSWIGKHTSYGYLVITFTVFLNPKQMSIPIRPISKYSSHFVSVPMVNSRPSSLRFSSTKEGPLEETYISHIWGLWLYPTLFTSIALLPPGENETAILLTGAISSSFTSF